MNSGNFEDHFDDKAASHRTASVEASLHKIASAMALLDLVGEDIAVAHLQAGFDVLSVLRQKPSLTVIAPS